MPISRPRSGAEIAGIPRGSSEKQIFGNCVLPENRANQILARLLLESRFLFLQESPVGGLQVLLGIEFRPHAPFRQSDQGAAHRKMALFRDATNFIRERRGNGNALTDRLRPGGAWRCLGSARHTSMLADAAPVWCRLGQLQRRLRTAIWRARRAARRAKHAPRVPPGRSGWIRAGRPSRVDARWWRPPARPLPGSSVRSAARPRALGIAPPVRARWGRQVARRA